jgi:hypothetical protein
MKKGSSARGGVTLEWQVTQPIVPHNNTIVVPFRLKEHKLRALGIQENTSEGGLVFRVILFLDDEILEDKEEVAKCVRALRRELEKELGDFKNLVISEKLAFLPELSGEKSAEAESLEIVPGVFYVGPQISVGSDEEGGQNLDLIARNCEVVGRLPMFTSA